MPDPAVARPSNGNGARRVVVVVDDEPDMLDLLCAILRAAHGGADIRAFGSPSEALDATDLTKVDLLITDYMMPGTNGLDLARQFRATQPDVPVILLTATPDSAVQNAAFLDRVNVFLKKPVEPREFLREVERVLASPMRQRA